MNCCLILFVYDLDGSFFYMPCTSLRGLPGFIRLQSVSAVHIKRNSLVLHVHCFTSSILNDAEALHSLKNLDAKNKCIETVD